MNARPEGHATDHPKVPDAIVVSRATKRFGRAEVLREVDLRVEPGGVVALLGPSGCGKTTLLRTIAGLEHLDGGEVRIGDRLVSGRRTHVPPERRRVGMVFQDWALFPHLTVAQNVGYGLPRAQRSGARVDEALAMVGLAGLGDRSPGTLSGGQQQRVALARALAPQPGVLLLDEPFSNLDSALRVQVRTEVHQLLAQLEVTTVFVTHDQEEAFVLGDEVAVMHRGEIVQQASPSRLYARPATPWVATFVGDGNLVDGTAAHGSATTVVGAVALDTPLTGPVKVVLRPEELQLTAMGPVAEARDAVPATVELCEYYGHDTVYLVRPDRGEPLRARAGSVPQFERGDRVALRYVGPPAAAYADESLRPQDVPVEPQPTA
ncbi:MAG: ABC transporter ATP-binding protein [Acidimicrobiales bacterium]|nr:ABC transporter ATP-binding protein [Acidimicrobiales bacterium]